jgi:hypothetical protein
MTSIAIKMKSYVGDVATLSNYSQGRLLFLLLSSLGLLGLLYVLILGNMVFNIVERKALEAEARTLVNDVGNLELTYLAMSGEIDLERADLMGFKEVKATFATRRALGSLSGTKVAKNEI